MCQDDDAAALARDATPVDDAGQSTEQMSSSSRVNNAGHRAPLAHVTLIRHAQSIANTQRVLQGVANAPLSRRGTKQLKMLEEGWRPTDGATNCYELPAPTMIVSSPIGRALETAHAVARATGFSDAVDATDHLSESLEPKKLQCGSMPHVVLDSGLCERNFGKMESTRRGLRAPGFSVPMNIGSAESDDNFNSRAAYHGGKWVDWAAEQGQAGETPHVVLVSHGQWINAFLSAIMPHLRDGTWTHYIKSANTALFTIGVHAAQHELLLSNDTRHLTSVTPPAKLSHKRRAQPQHT